MASSEESSWQTIRLIYPDGLELQVAVDALTVKKIRSGEEDANVLLEDVRSNYTSIAKANGEGPQILSNPYCQEQDMGDPMTSEMSLELQQEEIPADSSATWTESATLILLNEYEKRVGKFKCPGPAIKKMSLWSEIQEVLNSNGHLFSLEQMQAKWKSLMRAYKLAKKDNGGKKTQAKRPKCMYFERMHDILTKRLNVVSFGDHNYTDKVPEVSTESLILSCSSSDDDDDTEGDEDVNPCPASSSSVLMPKSKELHRRSRRLKTLAETVNKKNEKDGPMVLIYLDANGVLSFAGSPKVIEALGQTNIADAFGGKMPEIFDQNPTFVSEKQLRKGMYKARPLDKNLFIEHTEKEVASWGWSDLRNAVLRCVCSNQQNGKVTKIKSFWDYVEQPGWWPKDVPFVSPGKRVAGSSVLQKQDMIRIIRAFIAASKEVEGK